MRGRSMPRFSFLMRWARISLSELKEAAAVFEVEPQLGRIDDVAVVGQREVARVVVEEEGLDVLQAAAPRRRVADVADGHAALQPGELLALEDLRHEPAALVAAKLARVIDADDTAPLLPAVLQRMQPVVGQRGGLLGTVDAEHAALLVELPVRIKIHHRPAAYFVICSRRERISS